MNRVFIHVEPIQDDRYGGKVGYNAVVADDYVEDIEVYLMASPDFLESQPHVIAAVAAQDGQAYDVVRAAIRNGTDIYVNGGQATPESVGEELESRQSPEAEAPGHPAP